MKCYKAKSVLFSHFRAFSDIRAPGDAMRIIFKIPPPVFIHSAATHLIGPPDFIRIGRDLIIHPRPCIRPCVPKILIVYPFDFSEILHGVTTLYGGNVTFSDSTIILVCPQGLFYG